MTGAKNLKHIKSILIICFHVRNILKIILLRENICESIIGYFTNLGQMVMTLIHTVLQNCKH